jgi:hypothetical protein
VKKVILCCVLSSVIFLSGCGAIFYPERHGNSSNVDPKVAVFDGIGLIFFILPGVVAYAIDFATGCIYLSGKSSSHHVADNQVIPLDKGKDINKQVVQILNEYYGPLASSAMQINGIYGIDNWYHLQALN